MKHLDLFTGIGGFALAAKWAGIETIGFVEIDPDCQKALRGNFPDIPIIGDIKDVKEDSFQRPVDLITGGDPCQPRSVAGKRRGREDDRDLWKDMFRVIQEFKPTWIVNENPTGRLTMDFHEVLSNMESQGYETRSFVIPTCAVNTNHRRDRLFIIAHSDEHGLKGRGDLENKSGLAAKQIEIPTSWNVPCYSFGEWEKLINKTGSAGRYDGIPRRLVKTMIKQFGNAVVPQVAYTILKAIKDIES